MTLWEARDLLTAETERRADIIHIYEDAAQRASYGIGLSPAAQAEYEAVCNNLARAKEAHKEIFDLLCALSDIEAFCG